VLGSLLNCGHGLRFHSIFQDRMVLQREPASPIVWGFDELLPGTEARLYCQEKGRLLAPVVLTPKAVQEGSTWQVTIPPQAAGSVCDLEVAGGPDVIKLTQVVFGDVWLCSGQSNMEQNMGNIINSTEEIEASAKYTDIRFTVVKNTASADVDDDMDISLQVGWADPSDANSLKSMSAVCFLFARNIYDNIGVPLGLIDSDWGGTPVEAWMNPEALEACNTPPLCNEDHPQNCDSRLYNAMINPLKRFALKGFLWYQGEANAGNRNRDLYNCTFPSMISSWQSEFSIHSGVSEALPFGFVQLSTIKHGDMSVGFPIIRWHQTADYGYVPNNSPGMEHVFMAVALDTYDSKGGYPGGIHPRYKQIVGERLAIAGMNVAYGDESFPTNGPFPVDGSLDEGWYTLIYDQDLTYDDSEITGFYYCCTAYEECDFRQNHFEEVGKELVKVKGSNMIAVNLESLMCEDLRKPALAYLWRQTPVEGYLAAPIYADDAFRLPANPWKFAFDDESDFVRIK